ncbi:MAG: two-component system sensor histidine kinase NtrB [Limisphaerales bacterium]
MLETLTSPLGQRFAWWKPVTIILSLTLAIGVGVVDYLMGREIVMIPFYLLPICWASWVAGRRAGIVLSVVVAGTWLVADAMTHYAHPHRAIPYWNALMLLIVFAVVVYLLTAFHDAHLHLEGLVAQRTSALREEIAERKRLEAATIRAKQLALVGTMAAEMAHEVRNPLGSIALNLDLVRKEIGKLGETSHHAPEEGNLLVNEMRAEVHRIQHVLEDYLKFARISKLQWRSVAVNEWMEEKLAFMKEEFAQAGVKLRTDFDPTLPNVKADAEQLWQATLNLIRNGLEAMPEGGELTVSTRHLEKQAILGVSDNGEGITDEHLKQVFEPFFSTKPAGTGLGLALVQQIMIEHGGHVECESAKGKGSTFTLFLPLTENS